MDETHAFLNQYINVSRETFQKLSSYCELLIKWQKKVNLVSGDTIIDVWRRHFLDSLQLLPLIPNSDSPVIDMGTGAGFPGMVLAITGKKNVHLIDSDTKKILFLREVARITQTKLIIHHGRIGEQAIDNPKVIISRACSSLKTLFKLSSSYLHDDTICLFHKGKNYSKDIDDAHNDWVFEHQVIPSIADVSGVILKVTNLRKRGV